MPPKFQRFDGPSKNVYITGQELGAGQSAFGEAITTQNEPEIQLDFTHIIPNEGTTVAENGGTSARNANDGIMEVSSGTSIGGNAVFRSVRTLVYRPGQGNMARWSARYDTGEVGSNQISGILSTSDGFAFMYQGASFGILYRHHGDSEIQDLTITTPAGGAENATVTINGTGYTVALTGVGTVQGDANEIALSLASQIPTATFCQVDDAVVYTSRLSQVEASFAYSSATSVGAWVQETAGLPPIEEFIPQSSWNIDQRPDLVPTNFNVYQVQYQFLGAGGIEFFVEDRETGAFDLVHRIKFANTSTLPSLRNPNLYLAIFAENTTGTTSKTVATASMSAFHQGPEGKGGRSNTEISSTTVSTTLTNVATFMVRGEVGGRIFRGEIELIASSITTESVKGAIFELIIGATVAGGTDFQYFDEDFSAMLQDNTPGAVTGGRIILAERLGRESGRDIDLSIINERLVAGDTLTIAAAVTNGSNADCGASLVWKEVL